MSKMLDDVRIRLVVWLLSLVFLAGGAWVQVSDLKASVREVTAATQENTIQLREMAERLKQKLEMADRVHGDLTRRIDRIEDRAEGRPR